MNIFAKKNLEEQTLLIRSRASLIASDIRRKLHKSSSLSSNQCWTLKPGFRGEYTFRSLTLRNVDELNIYFDIVHVLFWKSVRLSGAVFVRGIFAHGACTFRVFSLSTSFWMNKIFLSPSDASTMKNSIFQNEETRSVHQFYIYFFAWR